MSNYVCSLAYIVTHPFGSKASCIYYILQCRSCSTTHTNSNKTDELYYTNPTDGETSESQSATPATVTTTAYDVVKSISYNKWKWTDLQYLNRGQSKGNWHEYH